MFERFKRSYWQDLLMTIDSLAKLATIFEYWILIALFFVWIHFRDSVWKNFFAFFHVSLGCLVIWNIWKGSSIIATKDTFIILSSSRIKLWNQESFAKTLELWLKVGRHFITSWAFSACSLRSTNFHWWKICAIRCASKWWLTSCSKWWIVEICNLNIDLAMFFLN